MNWTELEMPHIEGTLNVQIHVLNEHGLHALRREPINADGILESIRQEYEGIGFFSEGGDFRRRTPQEQFAFTSEAATNGLRVLTPLAIDGNTVYYPFVEGVPIQTVLEDGIPRASVALEQLFDDLQEAHQQGVVYGDRWLPNILFSNTKGITHIDFDIAISGPCAEAFEVAQVMYYCVLAGKKPTAQWLDKYLQIHKTWINPSMVIHFLKGHVKHFADTQYGGIDDHISELIQQLS